MSAGTRWFYKEFGGRDRDWGEEEKEKNKVKDKK